MSDKKRSKLATFTRRTFLLGSVAITGGVAFGYWKYKEPVANPLIKDIGNSAASLNPYVLIDQSGITVVAPRAEMGQGVFTTLAALVAEELDVDLNDITVVHGPASGAYYNHAVLTEGIPFMQTDNSSLANGVRGFLDVPAKLLGIQITGGSSSIPDGFNKMRIAGAAARESLLRAAAQKLKLPLKSLRTESGLVISDNGDSLSYLELAVAAADIEPSEEPRLKPQSEWKILGKSQPRLDMVEKCTGAPAFGIDVDLPEMLYATVKMNPYLGAPMRSFDAKAVEGMQGVERVFEIENGVAVVASNTWYALQAANQIVFDWEPANYQLDNQQIKKSIFDSMHEDMQDNQNRDDGDVDAALTGGDVLELEYQVPFLAHAPMEPMNATALLKGGKLTVWAGTQIPTQAVKEAIAITGLDESNIDIHTTFMGGSFGRRLEMDFIRHAILVANEMQGTPVKLTWSREEDMTHDSYRPMAVAKFSAVVNEKGPVAVDFKTASPSVTESQTGRIGMSIPGPDMAITQAAWDQPYAIENYRVTGYRTPTAFPVSSWRSVGASQNGFFHESMMDELAVAANVDPLKMRLDLVSHDPSRKVLEAIGELCNWGTELPQGHARGLAFCLSFGVPVAEVIEIALVNDRVKLVKAYVVADVGIALDPQNIEAQIFSGLNFGLSAAIMNEISIVDGKVVQSNFHDYQSIRMKQVPAIEIRILENGDAIRGIGEPATPPAAPALANAIFAATGKRIRELPLNKHIKFA